MEEQNFSTGRPTMEADEVVIKVEPVYWDQEETSSNEEMACSPTSSSSDTTIESLSSTTATKCTDKAITYQESNSESIKPVEQATKPPIKRRRPRGGEFDCMMCKKRIRSQAALEKHMLYLHTRTHQCTRCKKKFFKPSDLARHEGTHATHKTYQCEICGKGFSDPSGFKQHIHVHAGIKPYKCSLCPVAFTSKGHLTTHFRTHTGEKPYTCDQCDRTFARRDYVLAHLRSHLPNDYPLFPCTACDKAFTQKCHLKNHMVTHTKEKPFGCDWCGAVFTRRTGVTKHKKTVHRSEAADEVRA